MIYSNTTGTSFRFKLPTIQSSKTAGIMLFQCEQLETLLEVWDSIRAESVRQIENESSFKSSDHVNAKTMKFLYGWFTERGLSWIYYVKPSEPGINMCLNVTGSDPSFSLIFPMFNKHLDRVKIGVKFRQIANIKKRTLIWGKRSLWQFSVWTF